MKKLISGIVAVLLVFGVFTVWNQKNNPSPASASSAKPAEVSAAPTAEPTPVPEVHGLDYEAVRALHGEDETAIEVAGEKLDWGFYADFLRTNGMQYEEYFKQMAAYYGVAADWTGSLGDGSGMNYAQGLLQETDDTLASFLSIRAFAKEKGVELDEEAAKQLEPEQMAKNICGEDATVEQLKEVLEQDSHMTLDGFRFYSESVALYSALYEALYGKTGEKLTDEQVIDALEKDGYLAAHHILFMTIDPMTGKELEADAIAEKLAKAEEITKELREIKDPEALLKRFTELKAQYCEDTGKEAYPDGYTFTPGVMVKEFEDTVTALGEYEVSDPVKTSYGYHVILRLPLSADSKLSTTTGQSLTARESVAQNAITADLDQFFQDHPAEYIEGLEELDLTQYIKK